MCYCPLLRDRDKFPRIFLHYAHSTETQDCSDWQILVCHLRQVALRAAALGNKFGAAKAAALAGGLHDLGKYSDAYQAYIGGRGPGGGDHSTACAQGLRKLVSGRDDQLFGALIAYALSRHHARPARLSRNGARALSGRPKE